METIAPNGSYSATTSQVTSNTENLSVIVDSSTGVRTDYHDQAFQKEVQQWMFGTRIHKFGTTTITSGYQGTAFGYYRDVPDYRSSLYNKVLGEILERIRSGDVGNGLDLGVDLAEASQTKRMIKDVFKLVDLVRDFRRGRLPSDFSKLLKKAPSWQDLWLQYQYGWKPLVQDVYDSFDALMHRRMYKSARLTSRARRREDWNLTLANTPFTGANARIKGWSKHRILMQLEYSIGNTRAQQLSGYTSLNPASLAWELLPYSFVVDWVYDIGGYLRAMESAYLFGSGFLRGYYTYSYWDHQEVENVGSQGPTPSGLYDFIDTRCFRDIKKKSRTVFFAQPLPMTPQFDVHIGSQRLLSAASLLAQLFGRNPRPPQAY